MGAGQGNVKVANPKRKWGCVRSNPLLPGEGGRDSQRADAPGEGSNAKPFVSRALTRAPFFDASPYRARASQALCPLPEGEGLGGPTSIFLLKPALTPTLTEPWGAGPLGQSPARELAQLVCDKGKIADLVLLDANPLENISNTQKINAVVINDRMLDPGVDIIRNTVTRFFSPSGRATRLKFLHSCAVPSGTAWACFTD